MHILSTQNIEKKLYYLTRKKARMRFSPNATITGHRRGKVAFAERKPLPRSTANSTVTICNMLSVNYMYYLHIFTLFASLFCFL